MSRKGTGSRGRRLMQDLFLFSLCLLLLAVAGIGLGFGYLLGNQAVDPEGTEQELLKFLGYDTTVVITSTSGISSTISLDDPDAVREHGLDPADVAYAIEAAEWLSDTFGVEGNPGLYLAISKHESGSGSNFGNANAWNAAAGNIHLNATLEHGALALLSQHWKQHKVRENNSPAKNYVPASYDPRGVIGHKSAGEVGDGFIATTAWSVCSKGLSKASDPVVKSCDFWDRKTSFHAIAYWVYAIGYRNNLSESQQVAKLYGWNQMYGYRKTLVADAKAINSLGLTYSKRTGSGFGSNVEAKVAMGEMTELQKFLAEVFVATGFIRPESLEPHIIVLEATTEEGALAEDDGTTRIAQLPNGMKGKGVVINLASEVPVNDGESYNVALWATLNPTLSFPAGGSWDFCAQTSSTGWSQYKYAAGINAGGICFNASMIWELAQSDSRLQVTRAVPESRTKVITNWPRHHHVVNCPGATLTIRNTSNQTITARWYKDGNNLYLAVEK